MKNFFYLSDLRKERNLSQAKFALEMNVSPGTIAMYETGKRKPPLDKAIRMAEFFNLPVERIRFCNKNRSGV